MVILKDPWPLYTQWHSKQWLRYVKLFIYLFIFFCFLFSIFLFVYVFMYDFYDCERRAASLWQWRCQNEYIFVLPQELRVPLSRTLRSTVTLYTRCDETFAEITRNEIKVTFKKKVYLRKKKNLCNRFTWSFFHFSFCMCLSQLSNGRIRDDLSKLYRSIR